METTKLQNYAIAYTLGVSLSDIKSTAVDIENDTIIVHYNIRYYNSPTMARKILSYADIYDTVKTHGRTLCNI